MFKSYFLSLGPPAGAFLQKNDFSGFLDIAIFEKSLRPNTYFVIALLNGSFVFGRVVSILHDGMPDQLLWTIFVVDFTVFILAAWRYNALR